MTEIRVGDTPVTLINLFVPKLGMLDEFVAAQTTEYERLKGRVPGALTVNLHRGTDATAAVNYAQFAGVAEYEAWQASDLFRDHFGRIEEFVEHADPHLYEVAYTNDRTARGVSVIDPAAGAATFINVMTTAPDRQRQLLDFVVRNDAVFSASAGFRSTNVHRSIDGTRVADYSQWGSPEAFLAAFRKLVGKPVPDLPAAMANQAAAGFGSADFRFYDIVYCHDERS